MRERKPVKRKVGRPRKTPVDKDRGRYYRARASILERKDKIESGKLIEPVKVIKMVEELCAAIQQKVLQSDLGAALQDELIEDLAGLKKNSRSLLML